jgi:hypothetical protein
MALVVAIGVQFDLLPHLINECVGIGALDLAPDIGVAEVDEVALGMKMRVNKITYET